MLEARHYLREISLKPVPADTRGSYPFNLPAIRGLNRMVLDRDVTFIVGENGSGKSTLLEAIAVAWGFNAEGGTANFRFSTRKSHSILCDYLRIVRSGERPRDGFFLRAESFFNLATNIEEMDREPGGGPTLINSYGGRSLHEQSHGESFLSLMVHRFSGRGLYVLDEPEAALSPNRQLAILRRIHDLVLERSQVIIATHSPILMAYPVAKILMLTDKGFTEVNYTETEHYIVMKEFLNNPGSMLDELFSDS
jgi:predicted ATPase